MPIEILQDPRPRLWETWPGFGEMGCRTREDPSSFPDHRSHERRQDTIFEARDRIMRDRRIRVDILRCCDLCFFLHRPAEIIQFFGRSEPTGAGGQRFREAIRGHFAADIFLCRRPCCRVWARLDPWDLPVVSNKNGREYLP